MTTEYLCGFGDGIGTRNFGDPHPCVDVYLTGIMVLFRGDGEFSV